MNTQNLLEKYRRILNAIHAGGSIRYDANRKRAYEMVALLASNLRAGVQKPEKIVETIRTNPNTERLHGQTLLQRLG